MPFIHHRSHATIMFLLLFVLLSSFARAGDLPDNAPNGWWYYYGQTPAQITSLLTANNARLFSLQVERASPLLFTVAMVQNTGQYARGWWWYYGQSGDELSARAKALNARITNVDAYEVNGKLFFAAVLIRNTGADARVWWWRFGQSPTDVEAFVKENKARLVDFRAYLVNGQTRYVAAMVDNSADALGWWFYWNQSAAQVASLLKQNGAYPISLQVADPQNRTFNVVMNKNPTPGGRRSWWYFNIEANQLESLFQLHAAWLPNVKSYESGGRRFFSAVMLGERSRPTFPQNVLTQHNNNARQGAQLAETTLTPANVASKNFGLLFDRHVLGTVLAQPLYVRGVQTSRGLKNLILIATAQDVVYAFDAEDRSPDVTRNVTIGTDAGQTTVVLESTKYIWRVSLGSPHLGDICDETVPHVVGISSTPVIDATDRIMYVVARNQDAPTGFGNDYVHMIDIETGHDKKSVKVGGTDPQQGIVFDPAVQRQRVGLLLQQSTVYLGYGTYSCDQGAWRGWVFGYRNYDLAPAGIFTTAQTPTETGSGVWQSGNGLAGTDDGSIYFQTGNDVNSSGPLAALGDSFVKLHGDGNSLSMSAHYQPARALNYKNGDTDLGAGGPMLLPGDALIGGGKDGVFYVLSQSALTPTQNDFQAFYNTFHAGPTPYPFNTPGVQNAPCPPADPHGVANKDQPCYIPVSQYQNGESFGPNIHTGPVFWQDSPTHGFIYKMAEKDYLKAFDYDVNAKRVGSSPAHVATVRPLRDGMPGGFSSISANGLHNGVVWTVVPQDDSMYGALHPALLYANDASTLKQLWTNESPMPTTLAKFAAPTIADGEVVLPSEGLFLVYGLAQPNFAGGGAIVHPRNFPLADAITTKWLYSGGAYGLLGTPQSAIIRDAGGGGHQDFTKLVENGVYGQVSVAPSVKIGRPMEMGALRAKPVLVVSSIYFRPGSDPHFVVGEVRRLWLELGGLTKLGYPITDEIPTPDGFGMMSKFEHGTITWHPGEAAKLQP